MQSTKSTAVYLITILLVFLLNAGLVQADAVVEKWVASYNGPGNYVDSAYDIAIDSRGNVYVTGKSFDSNTASDYTTIKYDPNGNQKWVARYNGPVNGDDSAHAIAIDLLDNVYVTGQSIGSSSGNDYTTIKYDSNGTQKWVARYNGPANGYDSASAITVDNSGNVYITGNSVGSTSSDYVTIKYDTNGIQKWVARYDGPANKSDVANGIAVDNSGNVYITGNSIGSGANSDYATIKYDPNGTQKWVACYNGPGNNSDVAYAIAVDSSGNVYITGDSYGSGTNSDYATIKYDPNGNQKWVMRYNGSANSSDSAYAIAVDSSGNVYATGDSYDSNTSSDYATIKYDPNGNQKWVVRYNGPGNDQDWAAAIVVDGLHNVYVTGGSTGSGTLNDYATVKYDPNGNQKWAARYNGPANNSDGAYAMAVNSQGDVYVAGETTGSTTNLDYTTIKYMQHDYCKGTLAGDFDRDCKVNFADFTIMALDWLMANDWNDLAALADNWLKCNFTLQEDCW